MSKEVIEEVVAQREALRESHARMYRHLEWIANEETQDAERIVRHTRQLLQGLDPTKNTRWPGEPPHCPTCECKT